jgi:WD40 repeat protein
MSGARLPGQLDWAGRAVTLSPDGGSLAWTARENRVILWDVGAGKERERLDLGFHAHRLAFSLDGGRLWAHGNDLVGWPLRPGGELFRVDFPRKRLCWCAFSPDRSLLARMGEDPAVEVWDMGTGRSVARFPAGRLGGMSQNEERMAFSPDGALVAMADGENRLHLWEVASGAPLPVSVPGDPFSGIAFSGDGRLLATAHRDGTVQLREPETLRVLQSLRGHDGRLLSLAFLPGRPVLATGGEDTTILLWDVASAARGARDPLADAPFDPARLWEDLRGADAALACRAVRGLGDGGDRAVAWLRDRLLPPAEPGADSGARVRRLIADLDHEDERDRAAATDALRALGSSVAPELRAALEAGPSAEARARLAALLAQATGDVTFPLASGDMLRRHRAIRALERIGAPEALRVLDRLAVESPHLRERAEAAAAAARLRAGSP